MSIETAAANDASDYDPWADGATEAPADEGTPEVDEFDDLLAGMEEEESGEPIHAPIQAKQYSNPYDVGLKDMMWVPIVIGSAKVEPRHIPRLSSKVCIATLDNKRYVLNEQVEAALKAGGTEEIRDDVPLPYFVCTANHASDEFQRRFDYEIEVPVFTIKTALFKAQNNGRTGYPNESGRSLRLGTGATTAGEKVTRDNMAEIAARMEGQIVMAQLTISQAKKARLRPVLDEQNQPISVLLDAETGSAVTVFRQEDGSGYVVEGSGEVWEGDEAKLVQIPSQVNRFALRDTSESSGQLQEQYFPINDYLKATFLPVPERKVTIQDRHGVAVEGEITLDTIGAIARSKTLGATVDVYLRTGRKVTARWLGTEWIEVVSDGDGMDEFVGSTADPVSAL